MSRDHLGCRDGMVVVIQVAVTLRLSSEDSAAVWNDAGVVAVAVTDAPLLSCPGRSAAVQFPLAAAVVVASRAAASPWPWSPVAGAARWISVRQLAHACPVTVVVVAGAITGHWT